MSGYSNGIGQPPMNCHVCGCRVGAAHCGRHAPPRYDVLAIQDKYIGLFILRVVASDPRS